MKRNNKKYETLEFNIKINLYIYKKITRFNKVNRVWTKQLINIETYNFIIIF